MDESDVCHKLQGRIVPILGTWHISKQIHAVVWAVASKSFMQGLFKALCPGATFFNKGVKLRTIMTYFTYIRLSYPRFKKQLDEAIQNRHVQDVQLVHLANLRTLIEVMIPIVS
jgi:hypothetical protein